VFVSPQSFPVSLWLSCSCSILSRVTYDDQLSLELSSCRKSSPLIADAAVLLALALPEKLQRSAHVQRGLVAEAHVLNLVICSSSASPFH